MCVTEPAITSEYDHTHLDGALALDCLLNLKYCKLACQLHLNGNRMAARSLNMQNDNTQWCSNNTRNGHFYM